MAVDVYGRVGARIQALRKAHRLTQNKLAERAEVGVSYLVKVEGGVRKARLEVLERISNAMGEPLWRLFADQRISAADEKRWHGEANKLVAILPRLSADDLRAVLGVAQQLVARRPG
jgi:transcriptional regulator with XRE-family HTH domain